MTRRRVRRSFERAFRDGETVFEEGAEAGALFVVQAGRVELRRTRREGVHVLAILEPGAFFGESSALLGEHRSCSAVAVGPTRVLEVGTDLLEAMTVDRPEVAIRLIRGLAARLNAAEQRLAAAGLDGLSGPLAQYVAGRLGENSETEARFRTSLRELATGSALSMHEAHQALHQLIDRKLLHVVGEELVVPDREALTTAAPRPVERR